jgi:flagellar biosynthesis protein FlhF
MLQTFQAKDMRSALSAMRAELGEDAVILTSESTADGSVVVRAAVHGAQASTPPSANLASFETRYRDDLIAKLRFNPPRATAEARPPFVRKEIEDMLELHRVPRVLAKALAQDADASLLPDLCLALSAALDKRMRMEPVDAKTQAALLLVGPYGAGKTTIAAKLAAQARLLEREIWLATTDVESAGQRERLETFAAHLDVDLLATPSPTLLSDAVALARDAGALLIADSAGVDPRRAPQEFLGYAGITGVELLGVVSATTDAEDAGEIASALAQLGAKRLVVTGLDLARRKGSLTALAASGLAIAQVTRAPYLAQGLETLTPLTLSRILLARVDQVSEA